MYLPTLLEALTELGIEPITTKNKNRVYYVFAESHCRKQLWVQVRTPGPKFDTVVGWVFNRKGELLTRKRPGVFMLHLNPHKVLEYLQ